MNRGVSPFGSASALSPSAFRLRCRPVTLRRSLSGRCRFVSLGSWRLAPFAPAFGTPCRP